MAQRSRLERVARRYLRDFRSRLRGRPTPSGRKVLNYLHIGKTGGTTLKSAFKSVNGAQSEFWFRGHSHQVRLADLRPDVVYFFSLRDPLERFHSAFNHHRRLAEAGQSSRRQEEVFESYPDANSLAEQLFLPAKVGQNSSLAMLSLGHVIRFQHFYFEEFGNFLEHRPPLWVLHTETLEEDFRMLLTICRLDGQIGLEKLPKLNVSPEVTAAGEVDSCFSDEARSNLRRWFALDIQLVNLTREWKEQQAIGSD